MINLKRELKEEKEKHQQTVDKLKKANEEIELKKQSAYQYRAERL